MRLIDADNIPWFIEGVGIIPVITKEEIDEMPTADAVPVIRCCDCMHFEYFEDQFVQMTHCDVHDKCPDYTDFCSWAERKEE